MEIVPKSTENEGGEERKAVIISEGDFVTFLKGSSWKVLEECHIICINPIYSIHTYIHINKFVLHSIEWIWPRVLLLEQTLPKYLLSLRKRIDDVNPY